ncbi:MAG: 2TM domain-containing protein [Methanomicrobiales archaeon]|nr:2TM domain-containing protein [Methanomicrobiales archaeon]
MPTDEELRQIARKSAEEKVGFYIHFSVYIMVNLLLITIWYTSGGGFPWFIFPLLGWGAGVVAHYIGAFRGQVYVERLAEEEYRRLKGKD